MEATMNRDSKKKLSRESVTRTVIGCIPGGGMSKDSWLAEADLWTGLEAKRARWAGGVNWRVRLLLADRARPLCPADFSRSSTGDNSDDNKISDKIRKKSSKNKKNDSSHTSVRDLYNHSAITTTN